MPRYSFECECGHTKELYTSFDAKLTCECGRLVDASLPKLSATTVTEKVDKMSNKHWMKDQKEVLLDRSEAYFWSVEVPRFVESGVYSMETMMERQWVYYDAKGNLQTRTVPPGKG